MPNSGLPHEAMVLGADGLPKSFVNIDQMQTDATLLMYDMAAAAGDDDKVDAVAVKWSGNLDPEYFGYVAAGALSLLTRSILSPTLDTVDRLAPDLNFRTMLRESRDRAFRDLDGSGGDYPSPD